MGTSLSVAAPTPVVAAKAVSAAGEVLIRNDEGEKTGLPKMRKLKAGEEIYKGDVINTSSSASAKLLFTDRSVLDLGGSTLFRVDEYQIKNGSDRNVGMTMSYGKVRAAVNTPVGANGKYNIRTKTATMGVRGTEFIIASDLGEIAPPKPQEKAGAGHSGNKAASGGSKGTSVKTQITVIEGKVEVSEKAAPKKAPIAVNKGEQLTTVSQVVGDKPVAKSASAPEAKVVELSVAQMKTVVQETKIEDKTFKQAITIENSQSGPSSGISTLSAMGSTLSSTPDFVPNAGQIGSPGTFGPSSNPGANTLVPGMPINLTVVFKK
ncbi:FecR family protein [Bdellovibrionota bacterium FG-1]